MHNVIASGLVRKNWTKTDGEGGGLGFGERFTKSIKVLTGFVEVGILEKQKEKYQGITWD